MGGIFPISNGIVKQLKMKRRNNFQSEINS